MSRQRFALPHPFPKFLFSLLALCVPMARAQNTLLSKQTSTQLSKHAGCLPAAPEAGTRVFPFPKDMPLGFTPDLGQAEPALRLGSSGAPLVPPNESIVKKGAGTNYFANTPAGRLTNSPDNVSPGPAYTRSLQYYGQHLPLVAQTLVRIGRLAESHPRVTQILRVLIGPRNPTSGGGSRIRGHY